MVKYKELGDSPSGKAAGSGPAIRGFESLIPSQTLYKSFLAPISPCKALVSPLLKIGANFFDDFSKNSSHGVWFDLYKFGG